MATIRASTSEKIFKLTEFKGLNENPDGDTKLKFGEAAVMRNWRITNDKNLKRRPGSEVITGLCASYTIITSQSITYEREDARETSTLKMFPNVSAGFGKVQFEGEPVTVDASDPDAYLGYFFERGSAVYQLDSVIPGNDDTTYKWKWRFKTVRCTPVSKKPVMGFWTGNVSGHQVMLAACNGKLFSLYDDTTDEFQRAEIGSIDTSKHVHMFAFSGIVYLINGSEYKQWDGTTLQDVHGYRPLVTIAVPPDGGGETLEQVNKLCGERRSWFSPDGTKSLFRLPETHLSSLDWVKDLKTGDNLARESEETTGSEWLAPIKTDLKKFRTMVTGSGTYTFIYDRPNYRWLLDGNPVNMDDYGITFTPTVVNGSTIAVVYSAGGYIADISAGEVTFTGREVFLGDAAETVFNLDKTTEAVCKVYVNGAAAAEADYTFDTETKTLTFVTAPAAAASIVVIETLAPVRATNSIEIAWTMPVNFRGEITSMMYSELYAGTQDNRVFLYGDGTNKCLYSDLDYDGNPRADYFPDLNVVHVGESNTPITGMIRHYSRLLCYKTNSSWVITFGQITLSDGTLTSAFYTSSVNKEIGNHAFGQVVLVDNNPRTLHGTDLYEWRNNNSYSINLSSDERQAQRISGRIYSTIGKFDFEDCYCYDDNDGHEYYVCNTKTGSALVHNYAADAWYEYTGLPILCMANMHKEVYFGTDSGLIMKFIPDLHHDNGEPIDSYWESGSMAFGEDYMRKYSAMTWVGMKPEANGSVVVTVQTDRKSSYPEKVIAQQLFSFAHANFNRWSFRVNRKPFMTRLKLKAKKFVYYKLVFKSDNIDTGATILAADMRVRFTGYAK